MTDQKDQTISAVPKKPIQAATEMLVKNGYRPYSEVDPVRIPGMSVWYLPGSDLTVGLQVGKARDPRAAGAEVVDVYVNVVNKFANLPKGKDLTPSFSVGNMKDLFDFANDFMTHGVTLPKEQQLGLKKQKLPGYG